MARNFQSIAQAVYDDIYISDTDASIPVVKRFINRSYKELARRSKIEKKVTINAIDNKFSKPSDYVSGLELYCSVLPITFVEEENNIISPYSGELTFIYNYDPLDMVSDNDVPSTASANDEFIVEWTKYLWFNRENKKEYKADIHRANAEQIKLVYPKKELNWTTERGS